MTRHPDTLHDNSRGATRFPVLTSRDQLDAHLGKVVTIRGLVTNTKIPSIIGVDVKSYDPDLRGQVAEATGRLERYEVTEQDLAGPASANRGAGTFYRLVALGSNGNARVQPVEGP